MRDRLAVVMLTGVSAGALAAAPTARTLPIVAALAVLFGWSIGRPHAPLAVLTVPAAIGAASLASFRFALGATAVVLVVVAWSARHRHPASTGESRLRGVGLPTMAIAGALLVAVGIGDVRVEPDDRAEEAAPSVQQPTPVPFIGSVGSVGSVGGNDDLSESVTSRRAWEILDAQRSLSDEYRVLESADILYADGNRWTSDESGPSSGSSSRIPWVIALVALVVTIYTLFASRRFSRLQIVEPASGVAAELTPLDWYDRIVDEAGHPRHPADPVLRHSRDVAERTGDERFLELGRLVSGHMYNGRTLTESDFDLISGLRRSS